MVKIVILLKGYPKVYKEIFCIYFSLDLFCKTLQLFFSLKSITYGLSLNNMAIAITSFLASHSFTIRTDFFIPYRSSIHDITLMGV